MMSFIRENALFLGFLVVLVAGFLILRTRGAKLASVDEFNALIGQGEPVLVEFYSNTWTACLVAKPIVDGIERELEGTAKVIRLNVTNQVGNQMAQRYGVRGVPTIVVLDGAGEVVTVVVGVPDRADLVAQVQGLSN